MKNDLFSIGKVTIHGYGLMIALGFLLLIVLMIAVAFNDVWKIIFA